MTFGQSNLRPNKRQIIEKSHVYLTLHDKYNRRIVGYDNAHGIKPPKKKKFSENRQVWYHKHHKSTMHPYEFENAYQLLEDFWKDVNSIITNS